ncbi:hypothetical protein FC14_GL000165 [Ligilactobacillus agilis DSM 20509]|uniref:Glycosyltransferase 2-like domain-containing protein n=1 Tax=Ligilactobacillus agilis DSM 20509 TaxID=1423718 RepID=A0A0R2A9W7_9LACO|nr:glycosyltransferase [Ligilactobacillus agilis]KRM63949.1 hypothetical protein FC14_GL000165 [Ligilactobacillus agilis DSM 20509]
MKIAVVLVTFNRLNSLKIALEKYASQTKLPQYIVVVDNASTDGTADYLDEWKKIYIDGVSKIVINSKKNLGGAGGFALGMKQCYDLDCDYIFLADDDAMPDKNMFYELEKTEKALLGKRIAALCTAIYNNGIHEYMHRCIIKKDIFGIKFKGLPEKLYKNSFFKVDILTFVGACINKEVAKKIGNIKEEYFIYFDDSEYSIRLNEEGDIFCIPSSIMYHDVESDRRSSWKDYYDTRNWIDLVKTHYSKPVLVGAIIKMYLKRVSILAKFARNRSKAHRKMCRIAINDGLQGNLGLNKEYGPGKKINS